jgi:hypothetical protein
MTPKEIKSISVECPCCGARLEVDPELQKVLSYEAPPPKRNALDLDHAASLLKEQEDRREAIFKQSSTDLQNQAQLLERKFAAALEKSKGEPVQRPTRDIDLD